MLCYYQQLVKILFYFILIMFLRMSYYIVNRPLSRTGRCYKVQLNEDTWELSTHTFWISKNYSFKKYFLHEHSHINIHAVTPVSSFSLSLWHTNSGVLVPGWRAACWVVFLFYHGCLDTPSEKTPWVTWSLESVWGSCSYRRVRNKVQEIEM